MRLILMRHAKSDWGDPGVPDHDRPLNARGRAAAPLMGGWLREHGFVPGAALVSTAIRARETYDLVKGACEGPEAVADPRLYLAAPDEILERIAWMEGAPLIVVGHNPGFAALASWLVREAPEHPDFEGFPTCATLVLELDAAAWHGVVPGTGRVLGFEVPRALTG